MENVDPKPGGRAGTTVSSVPRTKRGWAKMLAEQGFHIFPLEDNGKKPRIKNWPESATSYLPCVENWWRLYPDANIGIFTGRYGYVDIRGAFTTTDSDSVGRKRALLVVDVDDKAGKKGSETLVQIELDGYDFPLTRESRTATGGRHLIYFIDKPVKQGVDVLGNGLDVRSHGGYIVGPGSTIGGKLYSISDSRSIARAPEWIVERCGLVGPTGERTKSNNPAQDNLSPERATRRAIEYLQERAPKGEQGGRNDTGYKVANEIKDIGVSEPEAVELMLEHWNCEPMLDLAELKHVIRSAFKYGESRPGIKAAETEFDLVGPKQQPATETKAPPVFIEPADHMGTARQFVRAYYTHGDARTLHNGGGEFYTWTGTHYAEVHPGGLDDDLYRFLDKTYKRVVGKDGELRPDPVRIQPNKKLVAEVRAALGAVTASPKVKTAPCWLSDQDGPVPARELVPVQNGLLHLPTRRLYPHTPSLFARHVLGFEYASDAPAPAEWFKFLRSIWPDDKDSVATLQEIMGYLISGETNYQKIFLMVGPKRSGKGTIARVIEKLLGQDFVAGASLASLSANFGLAQLIDKTACIIADARLGSRADQSAITEKLLNISGEDWQTVDRKYREAWSGRFGVRFLLLTNELPRLADSSGALSSRFVMLKMDKSFLGREDQGLQRRLLDELPGIFLWALDGWDCLQQRGHFAQPASARAALAELEKLTSPILAFIEDRCETGAGFEVECGMLYAAWNMWSREHGRQVGTSQTFARDLRAAVSGVETSNPRHVDGERKRFYVGIRLAG